MGIIGYIYCVTCLPTGKLYFGQTVMSIERRFGKHISKALRNPQCKFHRAIRKYGSDNFRIEEVMWSRLLRNRLLKPNSTSLRYTSFRSSTPDATGTIRRMVGRVRWGCNFQMKPKEKYLRKFRCESLLFWKTFEF